MVNQRFSLSWLRMVMLFIFMVLPLFAQPALAVVDVPPPPEDYNVLASGPVHEAFAEAVVLNPEPGIIAPKEPPSLIDEIPPDRKPQGDVQWIPGYWAWDDERNAFIWISGIWRLSPPGRQWVPGYWTPVSRGYQWISGYWLSLTDDSEAYLPEPPESVETGPIGMAPSVDYVWIPGSWRWHHGRYAWRAGYWAAANPDWIWVPAHYVWTPRGYLFVSGYWDFLVPRRGVLFAPVYFTPHFFTGIRFTFSPGFIIDLNIFDDALFMRPRHCHYYFGDYYAHKHYQRGIYPWFSRDARRVVYDPIYAHQRWSHRHDKDWEHNLDRRYQERRDHEKLRPPRDYDHRRPMDRDRDGRRPAYVMPINEAAKSGTDVFRFSPLDERERNDHYQRKHNLERHGKERFQRETREDVETNRTGSRSETRSGSRGGMRGDEQEEKFQNKDQPVQQDPGLEKQESTSPVTEEGQRYERPGRTGSHDRDSLSPGKRHQRSNDGMESNRPTRTNPDQEQSSGVRRGNHREDRSEEPESPVQENRQEKPEVNQEPHEPMVIDPIQEPDTGVRPENPRDQQQETRQYRMHIPSRQTREPRSEEIGQPGPSMGDPSMGREQSHERHERGMRQYRSYTPDNSRWQDRRNEDSSRQSGFPAQAPPDSVREEPRREQGPPPADTIQPSSGNGGGGEHRMEQSPEQPEAPPEAPPENNQPNGDQSSGSRKRDSDHSFSGQGFKGLGFDRDSFQRGERDRRSRLFN